MDESAPLDQDRTEPDRSAPLETDQDRTTMDENPRFLWRETDLVDSSDDAADSNADDDGADADEESVRSDVSDGSMLSIHVSDDDDICQSFSLTPENSQETAETVPVNLESTLVDFMFRNHVTHSAMHELLGIFNSFHDRNVPRLPKNPRTLLSHCREIDTPFMEETDNFIYLGLGRSFDYLFSNPHTKTDFLKAKSIKMSFNFDGLPLTKSNNLELWPILMNTDVAKEYVHVIGAYLEKGKPKDVREMITDCFINDLKDVISNGFSFKHQGVTLNKKVELHYIVCDLPALSLVKQIKGHAGYASCPKCTIYGERSEDRMCFIPAHHDVHAREYLTSTAVRTGATVWPKNKPKALLKARTDVTFRAKEDSEHQSAHRSPFERLPIDMVETFTLDGMHCVYLNGLKRFMSFLRAEKSTRKKLTPEEKKAEKDRKDKEREDRKKKGKTGKKNPGDAHKISGTTFLSLGNEFSKCTYPREFTRVPRNFEHYEKWKATELRMFLLYGGDIIIRSLGNLIKKDLIEAFQSFCLAIRILSDRETHRVSICPLLSTF
jgi:hypothetical protein